MGFVLLAVRWNEGKGVETPTDGRGGRSGSVDRKRRRIETAAKAPQNVRMKWVSRRAGEGRKHTWSEPCQESSAATSTDGQRQASGTVQTKRNRGVRRKSHSAEDAPATLGTEAQIHPGECREEVAAVDELGEQQNGRRGQ